jgi:hypothetical protein
MVWCAKRPTLYALTIELKPAFAIKADGFKMFGEGMAPVLLKDQWGYVNTKGRMVIPPRFVDAEPFSEGLAAVQMGGRRQLSQNQFRDEAPWTYIDKRARPIMEPREMLFAGRFVGGVAPIIFKERNEVGLLRQYCGLMDTKGTVLGKVANGRIARFYKGIAIVENTNSVTSAVDSDCDRVKAYIDRKGTVLWESEN